MRDKSGVNVKKILLSVLVLLALGTAAPVTAAPITGILNITGSVIVSAANIDWYPPTGSLPGTFTTKSPGTEYFSTIVGAPLTPNGGSSLDLGPAAPPLPGFLNTFVGTTLPAEYVDLSFDLDAIIIPGSPACLDSTDYAAGTSCTYGVFLLTQGDSGVVVKMEVAGRFVDVTFGDPGTLNRATGIYTAQLTEPAINTIREVVTLINGGGSIDTSYSATYTASAVPEPATLLTFGLGTAALAAHRRRRAKKESKG
jgi:hypothetical protein